MITGTLQGLAAGTILYVVMFEVLQRERERGKKGEGEVQVEGILQLAAIILGFSVMMVIEIFGEEEIYSI